MRSPFDLPDYDIGLGKRYRLRDDAEPTSPQVPALIQVSDLPSGEAKIEFYDVAHPSSSFRLSTRDFREVYDPAA